MLIRFLSIFLALSLSGHQQVHAKKYTSWWDEYAQLERKGFHKDALELAENIYKQSVKDGRVDQKYKALIHIYKNKLIVEEDALSAVVDDLKSHIDKASTEDEKSLFQILLAKAYFSHYQADRYAIINRTYSQELSDNFLYWDARQFKEQIHQLYQSALAQSEKLKQFSLGDYKEIVSFSSNDEIYEAPFKSLLDLLYYDAIQYYSSDVIQLTEAHNQFEINSADFFLPKKDFTQLKIQSEEESSSLIAIHLLQSWLKVHENSTGELAAFIDHLRLKYVNEQYIGTQKSELYARSLERAESDYTHLSSKSLFRSSLIKLWYEDTEKVFQYTPVQIVDAAQKAIRKYPDTYGAKVLESIVTSLKARHLQVYLEEAVPSQQAFKTLVEYKNVSSVQFKIIEWTPQEDLSYYWNEDTWEKINESKLIRSGKFKLPASQDLMSHKIELALQPLPVGHYALVVYTEDVEKDLQNGRLTLSPFYVTDLSVLLREDEQNIIASVKDRSSGQAVSQAQVEVVVLGGIQKERTLLTAQTQSDGTILIPKTQLGQRATYAIKVKHGQDFYQTASQYYYHRNHVEPAPTWTSRVQLYTDRAIYRPGQQLYVKGILLQSKLDTVKPVVNQKVELSLMDANYQKVSSQEFQTNEYGSFSGFFQLPEGGLNGAFTLQTPYGSKTIQVEEYKRPTFEVSILPFEGDFQLGDTIQVKGRAMAYSGATISNAEFRYTIQRKLYHPWWRPYARMIWPPFQSQAIVMSHGISQTDLDGGFEVSFIAETDKWKNDIYQYDIHIEIKDITGEVRTTSSQLLVGKNGVMPQMEVDAVWEPAQETLLKLSANNLQGVAVKASFKLDIQEVKTPLQPTKNRYWPEPDQFAMSVSEHSKLFPYDLYQADENISQWELGQIVWSKTLVVEGDTSIQSLPNNLSEGFYKLQATVIDRGDTLLVERFFEVREKTEASAQPDFLKVNLSKDKLQVGEKLKALFSTDLEVAYVYAYVTHKNNKLAERVMQIGHAPVSWEIPITEGMRGNIILHYEMVAQNRNHSGSQVIEVPFEQPLALKYRWKSFRNKLLPGSQENWELIIEDIEGQAVYAELLVSMYDQSLDQFVKHDYSFRAMNSVSYWYNLMSNTALSFKSSATRGYTGNNFNPRSRFLGIGYPSLQTFNFSLSPYNYLLPRMMYMKQATGTGMGTGIGGAGVSPAPMSGGKGNALDVQEESMKSDATMESVSEEEVVDAGVEVEVDNTSNEQGVVYRTNFNETAFFYPQLTQNEDGTYSFSFEMPDALTQWKFMALAHTPSAQHIIIREEVITQKDVMIQLNKPRFVRKGDVLYLKAKVSNLTDRELNTTSQLVFRDAKTNAIISENLIRSAQKLSKTLSAKSNEFVEWTVEIPNDYEGLIYEVSVTTGDMTDGESDMIPVLENRILITDAHPFFIQKKGKKTIDVQDYIYQSSSSESQSVVFEYTAQPVWNALMALPYLNEPTHASATTLLHRYYAQSISALILKSIPESGKLLQAWKKEGSLKSALEKNQELKTVVLEATPWLRDAQDETQQMQQLYRLLEESESLSGRDNLIQKLKELQHHQGGLSWFPGMPANRWITQQVAITFYRLQQIGAIQIHQDSELKSLLDKALTYLKSEVNKSYQEIKKTYPDKMDLDHLGYLNIQYLWLISHLPNYQLDEAETYFLQQAEKYALQKNNYAKAALAITLHRMGSAKKAKEILYSLKQSAVQSDKLGMYWKGSANYYWYQAPIETHALIIQAFQEVAQDHKTVDALKVWLLTQKQTNRWTQAQATADATYALLLTGGDWKKVKKADVISIDKKKVPAQDISAGLGYVKKTWNQPSQHAPQQIQIKKKSKTPSYGAIYHQYWEELDEVTSSNHDIYAKRTLYLVENTPQGEELIPISADKKLQVGDKVRVKLELQFDRDMEFFHIQDVRGSGFEPVNVISKYKHQNGLGYYEMTSDAATNFFIDFAPKGNFVFEYTVYVNVAGEYSSGLSMGESMYAPEFRFHSNGQRVQVSN